MNLRAYVAEFIGTFALCWVGILSIHHLSGQDSALLGIAIAHGLAIGLFVTATMAVSGGHLNPAVTLAMLMTKRIKFIDAFGYWAAQLAAGYIAALLCMGTLGQEAVWAGTPMVTEVINTVDVEASQAAITAMILEAIATFFLVFVIFGTAVDKRAHKMGGLFVGGAVAMGVLAIGPMTGAALNPARWFGPAVVGSVTTEFPVEFKDMLITYAAGPILGALVAALVFQYVMMGRDQIPDPEST